MTNRKRLGDILYESGLITEEQLRAALRLQRESGEKLGEALVKLGYVDAHQIADALSKHLQLPRVDLSKRYIPDDIIRLVPENLRKEYHLVPIDIIDGQLLVAMVDPLNIMVIDELHRIVAKPIKPVIATPEEITAALQRAGSDIVSSAEKIFQEYGESLDEQDVSSDDFQIGDAPGVRLTNMIFQQAIRENASDIHFEPRENDLRIRFRVDGRLRDVMLIPKGLQGDVTSRVKILAGLDITERRRPLDGRIQLRVSHTKSDVRISTLPTVYGEKIVARILNKAAALLSIEEFGFSDWSVEKLKEVLRQSQGLVLVTGPTGSGKTTTLYGCLNRLNDPDRNIITVEDPVEYHLEGINQVQINPKVNLTFANGLRAVLRQDPDIIMVGEIRDIETAEIAIRAALTGHLVLSTLHTNNAVAAVTRLLDMGIEPYLISSTVNCVIAQRLVRKLCESCKEPVKLTDPLMIRFIESLDMPVPDAVYEAKGCPLCRNTGYRGRTAVEELLVVNSSIREGIDNRLPEAALRARAESFGMVSLQKNAIMTLTKGVTSVLEVIRTVYDGSNNGIV